MDDIPFDQTVPLDRDARPPPQSRALFWDDLRVLKRPEHLVKGVFDQGTLTEIFGPTSCGKSFFATDIGLHIAAGWDWNGHRTRQAGVLYVNAEGGAAIVNRLDAWSQHHGEELDGLPFGVVIEPTTLLDREGVDQVLADASSVPDLGLVVIDTVSRVMPGSDDGPEHMGYLVAACDRIRTETGVAVCVVHHSGKDPTRGSRGSTVLPAATDTVIEIARDRVTDIATATLNKRRDGATGPLLHFSLQVIELGIDEDFDPITSCVVVASDRAPRRTRRMTDRQRRALRALNDALADHGEPAPNGAHYPPGALVVSSDLWRGHLISAGIIDKEAKNPRQDFKRLKDQLTSRDAVGEWDGLVWAVKEN